jgi:hypothetical protein
MRFLSKQLHPSIGRSLETHLCLNPLSLVVQNLNFLYFDFLDFDFLDISPVGILRDLKTACRGICGYLDVSEQGDTRLNW